MFQDGSYLTNKIVEDTLNHLLQGVAKGRFTSHSLRIGASTTAAANNIPPEDIRKAGRWKSDKYVGYVRATVPIAGLNPYMKG